MSEDGTWAKLARLFSRRPRVSGAKSRLDVDVVDPFERFEALIRQASEDSED